MSQPRAWAIVLFLISAVNLAAQNQGQQPPPQIYEFLAPGPTSVQTVSSRATTSGLGTYCYWIVATFPIGNATPSQPASCVQNAGGSVVVTWTPVPLATTYDVLRTTTPQFPNTPANILRQSATAATSFTDNLAAATSYTVNTAPAARGFIKLDNLNFAVPTFVTDPTLGGSGGTVTLVTGTPNQINVATGTTTPVLTLSSTLVLPGTLTMAPSSGNAILGLSFSSGGTVGTMTEGMCENPGSGNFQASQCFGNFQSGLFNPANGGNLAGVQFTNWMLNGRNASDNSDKKTMSGLYLDTRYLGAGQRTGLNDYVYCSGVGDCQGFSAQIVSSAFITAGGDEANVAFNSALQSPSVLVPMTTTTNVTSTCAITALSADVTKSTSSTDYKTVTVTGATTNCTAGANGDWLTIANGVIGSGDTNVEVIRIQSKTANSITALFQANHSGCPGSCPVAVSPVLVGSAGELNQGPPGFGQGQYVINLSGPSYNTGQVAISGNTVTFSGGATYAAAVAAVGGSTDLPGCISTNTNTVTVSPFNLTNARMWYPIQSGSGTSATLLWNWFDLDGGSTASAGSYIIRPCARVGAIQPTYASTSETVGGVVLESNPFTWTNGDNVEQAISPHWTVQHVINCGVYPYTVQGAGNSGHCYDVANRGNATLGAAYNVDPSDKDDATHAGWRYGIQIRSNTMEEVIKIGGRSLTGISIGLSAVTDAKKIHWEGEDSADIYRGASGTGFHIDSISGSLAIGNIGTGFTSTIGTASVTGNAAFNFPAVAAGTYTLCVTATGCGSSIAGPGSSTDNAITRWDGTSGGTVQNSVVLIDDSGNLYFPNATNIVWKDNGGTNRNMIGFDGSNALSLGGGVATAIAFTGAANSDITLTQTGASSALWLHHNNRLSFGGNNINDFFTALFSDTIHAEGTIVWMRGIGGQTAAVLQVQDETPTTNFSVFKDGRVVFGTVAFAGLGTPSNGSEYYCSDCTVTSGVDNTCAGSGGGAFAKRIAGAWKCEI